MFEFKILQSPDKSQQGTYEHNGDEILFGNTDVDMIIDDPHLGPQQLKIFFHGAQALAQNLFPDCPVKINNIPIDEKPTPVKARDTLQMGKTIMNLVKLKRGPLEPPLADEMAHNKAEIQPNSKEFAILKALENLANNLKTAAIPGGPPSMGANPPPINAGASPPPPPAMPKTPPLPPRK